MGQSGMALVKDFFVLGGCYDDYHNLYLSVLLKIKVLIFTKITGEELNLCSFSYTNIIILELGVVLRFSIFFFNVVYKTEKHYHSYY